MIWIALAVGITLIAAIRFALITSRKLGKLEDANEGVENAKNARDSLSDKSVVDELHKTYSR